MWFVGPHGCHVAYFRIAFTQAYRGRRFLAIGVFERGPARGGGCRKMRAARRFGNYRHSAGFQELLHLYGMMRVFFDLHCRNAPATVLAAKASFDAACAIVDIIQEAKRGKVKVKPKLGRESESSIMWFVAFGSCAASQ